MLLQKYFGYSTFHDYQKMVIEKILEKKELLGGHGHWQRQVLMVSHPANLISHFLPCVFASTLVLPFKFYVQFFKISLFLYFFYGTSIH